ncbi:MAG TPA: hypothetical protein VIV66_20880 [Pyrinomonadaceae bacterium]
MRTLLVLTTIALTTFPIVSRGQESRTSLKSQPSPISDAGPTRLALEVTFVAGTAPAYQTVPGPEAKQSGAWYGRFSRTPGWQLPEGALAVTAVKIESLFNGETVDIYVSVLRGKFHDQEDAVAVYHLGENEKRFVVALKSFGVEPFEIKVIRIPPAVVNPNNVINKTQSLEVITIKAANSTLPRYQLTLRNLSNKSISAIWLGVEHNGKLESSALLHHPEGTPLIAPGDVYETRPFGVTRALQVGRGYVPQPLDSQDVVLGALVFDDGSWEGIPSRAATFRAFVAGRRFQISSVLKSLERISSNTDLTVISAIEDLRMHLSLRDASLNSAAYSQVLSEFPSFTAAQQENLRIGVEITTHDIRKTLLDSLSTFDSQHPEGRVEDFRAWLLSEKVKYEAWLQRL